MNKQNKVVNEEKKVWKECYGCGIEMDLTVAEWRVEFQDGQVVDVCLDCAKGYLDEIPEDVIKMEAI